MTLLLLGCFPPGEGLAPEPDEVYFPVGLALDARNEHLFIANSDFDLQFNNGTVLSWDLAVLRGKIAQEQTPDGGTPPPCIKGAQNSSDQLLYPGRCLSIPAWSAERKDDDDSRVDFFAGSVVTGAFSTDIIYRKNPNGDDGRLFVPVRGDATLHWINVTPDGTLACGGDPCSGEHRAGDEPWYENDRLARMQEEPYGVDADERGEVLVVTNQTTGSVGLLENDWSGSDLAGRHVKYKFTQTGLPERPIGVVSLPEPRLVPARGLDFGTGYFPGFLVGYRSAPFVHLVRTYADEGSSPARPYTKVTNTSQIFANSDGTDSRGLAVDGSRRRAAETDCAARFGIDEACATDPACASGNSAYTECLTTASAVPLDVFVTNRTPASLLIGQSQALNDDLPSSDIPSFQFSVPLNAGPTRVVIGDVKTAAGERERRVFAVCFDGRRIVVYDPDRRRIETEIVTGRGPQAMAIDVGEDHAYGYVAHFTDSYIGVVELDQSKPTYGTIIASVGAPVPPRASK